jgi:excisionase family DNA binding protein
MMLTAKQVAEKLRVSTHTVREMCADGRLPGQNIAKNGSTRAAWRIDEKAFREWRAKQNGKTEPQRKAKAVVSATVDVPPGFVTLEAAAKQIGLTPAGVSYRVGAGRLAGVKVGRRIYVREADLTGKPAKPMFETTDLRPQPKPVGIFTALQDIAERITALEQAVAKLVTTWT